MTAFNQLACTTWAKFFGGCKGLSLNLKVAGAGYYNKILFITKHGNVYDVSVQFLIVR